MLHELTMWLQQYVYNDNNNTLLQLNVINTPFLQTIDYGGEFYLTVLLTQLYDQQDTLLPLENNHDNCDMNTNATIVVVAVADAVAVAVAIAITTADEVKYSNYCLLY